MKFNDLKFKQKNVFGGVHATHTFENGITINVYASFGSYCSPKEDLYSEHQYEEFEVNLVDAFNNKRFLTREILDHYDDVIPYNKRFEVQKIMDYVSQY